MGITPINFNCKTMEWCDAMYPVLALIKGQLVLSSQKFYFKLHTIRKAKMK